MRASPESTAGISRRNYLQPHDSLEAHDSSSTTTHGVEHVCAHFAFELEP
jgi:hypothetical protein